MKLVISAGLKTDSITDMLEQTGIGNNIDIYPMERLDMLKHEIERGNVFDRILIFTDSISNDGKLKDKREIRKNIADFVTSVNETSFATRGLEFVFVVQDEEIASIIDEEMFEIEESRKVICCFGSTDKLTTKHILYMASSDIGKINSGIVYKPKKESEITKEELDKRKKEFEELNKEDEVVVENVEYVHSFDNSIDDNELNVNGLDYDSGLDDLMDTEDNTLETDEDFLNSLMGDGGLDDLDFNEIPETDFDGLDSLSDIDEVGLGDIDFSGEEDSTCETDIYNTDNKDMNTEDFSTTDIKDDGFVEVDPYDETGSTQIDLPESLDFGEKAVEDVFNAEINKNKNEEQEDIKNLEEDIDSLIDTYDYEEDKEVDNGIDTSDDMGLGYVDENANKKPMDDRKNIHKVTKDTEPEELNNVMPGNTATRRTSLFGFGKNKTKNTRNKSTQDILNAFANRGNNIVVTGCGGCGTSTVALNIANTLSNLGYTCLIVDFDTEYKAQSYITSNNYKAVEIDSSNLRASINSSTGLGTHISIAKDGLHLLTMGIGENSEKFEDIINTERLARFINLVKAQHHFVIYDVPFDVLTNSAVEVLNLADSLVVTVDCSTWGITKTLLGLCNIESDEVMTTMFSKGQLLFNKCGNLHKYMGRPVKSCVDITQIMDNEVREITGVEPDVYFQNMNICGALDFDSRYEDSWFNDKQFSDTADGAKIYTELIEHIVLKD